MRTPHLIATGCSVGDPDAPYRHAELAIWDELQRSISDHPRLWQSPIEGAMVLAEEVDELWDEVRGNRIGLARAEATQVGALAVRFIADLYEPRDGGQPRGRAAAAQAQLARALVGPSGRTLMSSHEGFGYLKREFDALWSAVKFDDPARDLAARVAGSSIRFIAEIIPATAAAGLA